jgi:uncharacterized membrane protein
MTLNRTFVKTVAYKLIATAELALVTWVVTGSLSSASHVGLLHATLSTLTYAGFEHVFESLWSWSR